MGIDDLIRRNRSCRRYYEEESVARETLVELVNLARMSASAANRQPLRFVLSWEPERNRNIFPCLTWAAYLKDWPGPAPGERPAAYIVITGDTRLTDNFWCDHGIVSQSMLLGATARGLAGCMIGAFNEKKLRTVLALPEYLKIMLVLALGKPRETVVLEEMDPEDSIKYWRDENGVHHVPKRPLEELIVDFSD